MITPIGLDHTEWLGDTLADIATAKAGIVHSGATLVCAAQDRTRRSSRSRAAAPRSARRSPARAASSGCWAGRWPSAARCSPCRGWAGVYEDVFVPLHGAHQAQNAGRRRWPPSRRSSARAPSGSWTPTRYGRGSPGPARRAGWSGSARAPTILLDAAHNPHGMAATVAALRRGVRLPAARRGARRCSPTRTSTAYWSCWNRSPTTLVVTRNSSPRAMPRRPAGRAGRRGVRRGPGQRGTGAARRDRGGGGAGRGRRGRRAGRRRRTDHRLGGHRCRRARLFRR